ncbi:MAG: alpha/beta hydrolase-fold protein [Lentimicrobium sp.]|nr:alpha/beta hydrolase-fold protein [Lentimicrobium sp.]
MKRNLMFLTTLLIFLALVSGASAQAYIKISASFYSEALQEVKKIDIFLPPDYYAHLEQEYAVIYYLHGAGGNQSSGGTETNLYFYQHNQDSTLTSPPAIFVKPDGSCEPYMGSMYVNSALYGNYEDYIMQDVIGFIEDNFRAISDKNFRFITGLSMGGIGSARLAVTYPEMFRAAFPYIGFLAIPDTLLNSWKDMYYQDHGNYIPQLTGGTNTQLVFTMCGGFSPNMNNPPYYVDFPFDTSGVWIDSILNNWYNFDASRKVKDLPGSEELAWFLGCGTTDYMCTYPTYQVFMDSLDTYGINYDYRFFEGGHELNTDTWMAGMHWMDSIVNYSFRTLSVPLLEYNDFQLVVSPNPVKDQLFIEYQLREPAVVEFSVLDLYGQQLAIISMEKQQAAKYRQNYDVSKLPAGMYFCRVQIGNETITKKIIKVQ